MTRHSCIVAGGGAVGQALCLMLAHCLGPDVSIGLFAAADPPTRVPRLYTLTHASLATLARLGVEAQSYAFGHMQVRDLVSGAGFDFSALEYAMDNLGATLDEATLLRASSTQLAECSQVHIYPALAKASHSAGEWQCQSADGMGCTAPWVFAVDGSRSSMAARAEVGYTRWDTGDTAIVANLRCLSASTKLAWARQWFSHAGIVALLPVDGRQLSLVWCMPDGLAQQQMDSSDNQFTASLGQAVAAQAGRLQLCSPKVAFPIHSQCALRLYARGVVLLGNSACTLHPLAGQGFNLALLQLARLGDYLERYGLSDKAMASYQADCLTMNLGFFAAMRGIQRSFRTTHPLGVLGRAAIIRTLVQHRLVGAELVAVAGGTGFAPRRETTRN